MTRFFTLVLLAALCCSNAPHAADAHIALGKHRPPDAPIKGRLIGTWKLVSAGTFRPDGSLEPIPEYGPHPIGYLMYDTTGHMCVTLANPEHPRWANAEKPTDAEIRRSFDAMFAYCGRYEVRENEGRVIHRPEGTGLLAALCRIRSGSQRPP